MANDDKRMDDKRMDDKRMDDKPSGDAFAALRARFADQSRRAQAYYTAMHAVRAVVGSDDAASAWMEAPQGALGDQSPAQAIGAGRLDDVLALIRSLQR